MSSFTNPLDLRIMDKSRDGLGMFQLLTSFVYEVGELGSGDRVVVPAGFVTDLATIPRWARPFMMQAGRSGKAAVLHDFLVWKNDNRAVPIFAEALGVAGVKPRRRWLLVKAVIIWAWFRSTIQ
jgi:hypothetical protein